MSLDEFLASDPERCEHGWHRTAQTCPSCTDDEWATFVSAIRKAATAREGRVHQADVRPIIRGRIEPKHVGLLYRRARNEGLLREVDHERSDDLVGRNAGRMEPVYELRAS